MPQTTKQWNVLSEDKSKTIVEVSTSLSSTIVSIASGMWGSAMFGSAQLLGGGQTNSYVSNVVKNVLNDDTSKNVDRRLTSLVSVTLLTRMGMWGEVRFGDEDLLGTGILNYYEG